MKDWIKVVAVTFAILLASVSAPAQSGGVSLRPILKPGQEARYRLIAEVNTEITAAGANGISGTQSRELNATVLLRAGVAAPQLATQSAGAQSATAGHGSPYTRETLTSDAGAAAGDLVYYEAVIEMLDARLKVNGAETSGVFQNGVGKKIEFALDSNNRVVKCAIPVEAAKAGLAELLFSMLDWAPAAAVEVGQSWGNSSGVESAGNYGYISAAALSDVPKSAQAVYKLSAVNGGQAVIEGALALRQEGATRLAIPAAQIEVNLSGAGDGTTRIDYDVAGNRIASAVSESLLKGRVVNVQPTRPGEPMQPREGALVETAKFSIKLLP
ncbi:MAG TPA: hypothetical protein VJ464_18160 [Blastocatellia bacterium]|nr:hypothetical protein [Blastocatellia bacterium]